MAYGNPLSLSQDANGWTTFTPSAGARLCYVSEAGNDGTAVYYTPAEIGGDPFLPDGNMTNPYLTYATAVADCRAGTGDWVLFKRGDTFTAQIQERSGASTTDFALTTAYGTTGAMPIIHPATDTTHQILINASCEYAAFMGLDCYSNTRDPDSGDYVDDDGAPGFYIIAGVGSTIHQILIEGCKFRFFDENDVIDNGGTVEDIVIRRTLILDSYSDGLGNCQGLWANDINGFLVEENILDHNGWYSKPSDATVGPATIYNHNFYCTRMNNTTFRKNICLRASSGDMKITSNLAAGTTNFTIDNNLWVDGEISLSIGWNYTDPLLRMQNIDITDNVITNVDRDPPTERNVGWGFILGGIDTGNIDGNLFLNWDNPAVTGTFGLEFGQSFQNVTIEDNILYDLNPHGNSDNSYAFKINYDSPGTKNGNVIQNNLFQEATNALRMAYFENAGDISGFSFVGNEYYASSEVFYIAATPYNFAGWVTQTGETGSFEAHNFPNPTRGIESYMASLGETATIIAFINKCRDQSRYSWDTNYVASTVNGWIRSGFSIETMFNTSVKIRFE